MPQFSFLTRPTSESGHNELEEEEDMRPSGFLYDGVAAEDIKTSLISNALYSYVTPIIDKAQKHTLHNEDLPPLQPEHDPFYYQPRCVETWEADVLRMKNKDWNTYRANVAKEGIHPTHGTTQPGVAGAPMSIQDEYLDQSSPPPSGVMDYYTYKRDNASIPLALSFFKVLWKDTAVLGVIMVIESANRFAQTFLVHGLIDTVKSFHEAKTSAEREDVTNRAWVLAFFMCVSSFFGIIFHHGFFYRGGLLGLALRQCSIGMVHRKLLKLHNRAFQITTPGQINNIITSDVGKFDRWGQLSHVLWIAPLQLFVLAYLLNNHIGFGPTAVAIATLLVIMPLQTYLGTLFGDIRSNIAAATDKRMKVVREVLQGIKIIKMYGWEEPYKERILQLRKTEVMIILKSVWVRAVNQALFHSSTGIVTMATLLSYKFMGGVLTAEKVFTTSILLAVAKKDQSMRFAGACEATSEMLVALKRLSNFLLLPEVENREISQYSSAMQRVNENRVLQSSRLNGHVQDKQIVLDDQKDADNRYFLHSNPITGEVREVVANNNQYIPIPDHQVSISLQNVTAAWPKSVGSEKEEDTEHATPSLKKTNSNASKYNSGSGQLPLFQNISLKIQGAKFVAVVGRIASGKSSFLQLLLHEMEALSGKVDVQGSVAYVSQQSWLFNGSIKENIICGKESACIGENISGSDTELGENVRVRRGGDEWMYSCIHACALPIDLELMQHGVHTGVGESGASLSGGQRARVALCRALYSDADVYLIDDVFAPLDRRSTRWVYEDAIKTLLKDKLVILATHHTEVVNDCDYVVWTCPPGYIHKYGPIPGVEVYGNIIHGKPEDLVKIPEFKEMLDAGVIHGSGGGADDETPVVNPMSPATTTGEEESFSNMIVPYAKRTENGLLPKSQVMGTWLNRIAPSPAILERRESGGVGWEVFTQYIIAFGGLQKLTVLFVVSISVQCVVVSADLWMLRWVKQDTESPTPAWSLWTAVYIALVVAVFPFVLQRATIWLSRTVIAARRLHNSVLERVIGGQTRWFEARPIGQILNRFGSDTNQMDETLPSVISDLVTTSSSIGFIVLVVTMHNWPILFVLFPIGVLFYFLRKRYMQVSQQVKRLESMSKSPLYSSFSNCMDGLTVIRNIPQLSPRIHGKFLEALRKNSHVFVPSSALQRWFAVRLDCFSAVFISVTVVMAVILMKRMSSESVGLSLSYVLQLLGIFQWCIRLTTELEISMVSVERVTDLQKVPQERKKQRPLLKLLYHTDVNDLSVANAQEPSRQGLSAFQALSDNELAVSSSAEKRQVFSGRQEYVNNGTNNANSSVWPPKEGNILFYNASMRYTPAPGLRCLDRLNCYIPAGSKVGIVGRTGAGKSSVMNMLMRIVEMEDTDRYSEDGIIEKMNLEDFDDELVRPGRILNKTMKATTEGHVRFHDDDDDEEEAESHTQENTSNNNHQDIEMENMNASTNLVPNAAKHGVFIDGIDISALGLHQLRNSLAIIPQDPVLFSGTVRSNLDPFGYFDDQALIRALQKAQLYDTFFPQIVPQSSSTDFELDTELLENTGLNSIITESGSNLSVGTRQLLCLGRALTNEEAKVVILDECTASVDHVTDGIVQDVVRTQLKHCTLLIVAHRIQTIIDADYIIVMDKGCLVEFGSPHELLQMQGGIFADVVDKGGAETALALRSQAEECFKKKHKQQTM